jgi:hypothetical protein
VPDASVQPLRVHVLPFECERHWVPTFLEPFASELSWLGEPNAYQLSLAGDWAHAVPESVVLDSLESADVAVLPFDLEGCRGNRQMYARAEHLAAQAHSAGKVVLAFCRGDVEFAPPGPNCVVLRTSASSKSLGPRDVMMPAWVADPASRIDLAVRPWTATPTVNFVGFAYPLGVDFGGPATTALRWTKALARASATSVGLITHQGQSGHNPLYLQRAAAVAALRVARGVDSDIVLRQAMTYLDVESREADVLHLDYLRRMSDSDYTLAVRGEGNYSFRLYESLAVGRPVVSVRTGDVRPCAKDVPWDVIAIDVALQRLSRLGPAVRNSHRSHQRDWSEVQELCRRSWVESLSAPGYFRRLAERVSTLAIRGPLTPEAIAAELS